MVCLLQTPVAGTLSRGRAGVPASQNKARTSSWDSRNAFVTRPSSYSRLPPSTSAMSYTSVTKKVPSGGGTTITKRIEDLDKKSNLFQTEIEDVKTRHAALRYNYAIQDKELDVQKEELNFEHSNAELAGPLCHLCSLKHIHIVNTSGVSQIIIGHKKIMRHYNKLLVHQISGDDPAMVCFIYLAVQ